MKRIAKLLITVVVGYVAIDIILSCICPKLIPNQEEEEIDDEQYDFDFDDM